MKKILVLGNYKDAPYHPLGEVEDKLRMILADLTELTFTDKTRVLLDLSAYVAVVSYLDIWDQKLPGAEAEALAAFVKKGGGLLVIHNGICIQSDDGLYELIGGKFLSHPRQETLLYFPAESTHPVTDGVEPFELVEEPYQFEFTESDRIPLLTYRYRNAEYPAAWARYHGDGRMVYLSPGHTPEKFDHPQFQRLIRQGLLWVVTK